MLITVLAATTPHPVGGIMVIYELANGLARLGHHVNLVHINAGGGVFRSADEITWCHLDPRLRHTFPPALSPEYLPDAQFLSHFGGQYPERCGLPFHFVQGYRTLAKPIEDWVLRGPYPKLCPSHWLVDVCLELGVPEHQAAYLPMGLRHEKYRLLVPIEDRPVQIAMAYNSHPLKGGERGLQALAAVKRRIPEAEVVVFGARDPEHDVPVGITYMQAPPQKTIVEEIYNRSRVFLSSSTREGLGYPSLEAMACGCALVTTDSRGSREFAVHDRTAVVSASGEPQVLADHIEALLRDDARRRRIAGGGQTFVKRFDWDETARRLDAFLREYRADPAGYQVSAQQWTSRLGDEAEPLPGE